jgi:hypothetical protein
LAIRHNATLAFHNMELSDRLRCHHDCAAGALHGTNAATVAIVIVEEKTLTRAELDHGVIRANTIAVVAFEAIAARNTAPGLEQRVFLAQALLHLVEP